MGGGGGGLCTANNDVNESNVEELIELQWVTENKY